MALTPHTPSREDRVAFLQGYSHALALAFAERGQPLGVALGADGSILHCFAWYIFHYKGIVDVDGVSDPDYLGLALDAEVATLAQAEPAYLRDAIAEGRLRDIPPDIAARAASLADQIIERLEDSVAMPPVVRVLRPQHIGSPLQPREKSFYSREGPGLSVSTCPEDWRHIAQLSGEVHELRHPDGVPGRFMDVHFTEALSLEDLVRRFAVEIGLLRSVNAWLVSYYDTEWDREMSQWVTDQDLIEDEIEDERIVELTETWDGTPELKAIWEQYFKIPLDLSHAENFATQVALARLHGDSLDGMWWNDMADVSRLSSPRGLIFPDRVEAWTRCLVPNSPRRSV